jgi:ABC-type dipeptide/oligopeptide/nickel transport system permease subunit
MGAGDTADELVVERYKYILGQLHALNENVYKFLAIYQTLAVALTGAAIGLFVGYREWEIDAGVARSGIVALMLLITTIAGFVVLLIVVGVLSWLDYRREECELTEVFVAAGFRRPPAKKNFWRWYETWIVAFIVASVLFLWWYTARYILPAMT